MNNIGRAVSNFRNAIHQEGERAAIPSLPAILSGERRQNGLSPRLTKATWAAAVAVVLALGAIPAYQNAQRLKLQQREAEQEKADTLLMEQVNAGLSRSVPRAMTPLADWTPGN
jgi:putative copper export protein